MKILAGIITFIVIWLVLLTLCFLELSLDNQKRDDAYTEIRNVVVSLQMMMEDRTEVVVSDNRNYNSIIRNNNDIEETLESVSKNSLQSRYNDRGRGRDYENVYEKNNFLMWRDTKTLDPSLIRKDEITNTKTQAQIKTHHDSRDLASSSKINEINQNNNIADRRRDNTNTHRVQNEYTELSSTLDHNDDKHYSTTTSCILLGNVDLDVDDQEYNTSHFNLTMNLMTDARADEISFKLLQKDNNELVISSSNDVNLLPNTLHQIEYKCFVSNIDRKHGHHQKNETCYIFKLYDPSIYFGGQCCEFGSGYFEVIINKSPISFGTNRLHGAELSASFCIDTESTIVTQEEIQKKNETLLYPSRECKNHNCICDSNPVTFSTLEYDDMYDIKMNVLTKMMLLSGSENLIDVSSPEYRAACWVLLDDPYEYSEQKEEALERKVEERMIQRYILAMFYFATRPDGWKNHYQFLSGQSECSWNSDIYENEDKILGGCVCDENENIISISIRSNNLFGTLIDEIYGLNKIEKIHIFDNPGLHGTIPSTIGLLSNLQALEVYGNALEGTIPEQLFNATNLQKLMIERNFLSGTLPKSIGKLQRLSGLSIWINELTGSIPEELYSIESLVVAVLASNKFSGSIPQSIGNLKNLEWLSLDQNELSGTVPSTIYQLSRLIVLVMNDNRLSGTIPNIVSTSMSNLGYLALHNNEMTGSVSSDICNIESLAPDSKTVENKYPGFYVRGITSDCRNDVLLPQVECSCCSYCEDNSPTWSSDCADTTIMIKIDHKTRYFFYQNSDDLVWSLVDNTSGNRVVHDGRYDNFAFGNIKESYEVCASSAGCYSLVMNHPPAEDTNYTIFWNGESVYNGTLETHASNNYSNSSEKDVTMTSFYYDETENKVIFDSSVCPEKEIMCFGESIRLNNKHRVMYNTALKLSGSSKLSDESSVHSKALCWIIMNDSQYDDTDVATLEVMFTQRYVLTLLHLMSVNGLFGDDDFPYESNECNGWEGIKCATGKNIVTTISLDAQMIGGTLIEEIGSLVFLEVLSLRETELVGQIPFVFANLYSLKDLDLSRNKLSGSIPFNFFDQLESLRTIDLSFNDLDGVIPSNIGSHSDIQSIQLNNNKFIGQLPMEGFSDFNLQVFDVSENQLSGVGISALLIKHTNLAILNLASNFFVGQIQENIFVELSKLEYFNVSKNEMDGKIPTKFAKLSMMTHFDIHSNRFSGTVPMSITNLISIEHLNLQGNYLTGSIPSELNELKRLEILALGHNELKGSIPLDLTVLTNVDGLYLHNNKLSGEAPKSNKKMKAYITDCGYPSDSLEPVSCSSCDVCCNSDAACQKNSNETITSTSKTFIIIFSLYGFIICCYTMKGQITNIWFLAPFFSNIVSVWDGLFLISGRSIYHFMLTKNKVGWLIAFACCIFQMLTLFLFVRAADINSESGDLEYTMTCPSNSLDCENVKSVSPYGVFIFSTVIGVWLLRDIISSIKLMMLSFEKKSIDFLFASSMILLVTVLSLWTSAYYILAIATKNTDLIKDAVILLFVIEIDERIYQLAETINPTWVREVEMDGSLRNMRNSMTFTGDDLLINSWIQKSSENFTRSIPSLRSLASFSSFSKKRVRVKQKNRKNSGTAIVRKGQNTQLNSTQFDSALEM